MTCVGELQVLQVVEVQVLFLKMKKEVFGIHNIVTKLIF